MGKASSRMGGGMKPSRTILDLHDGAGMPLCHVCKARPGTQEATDGTTICSDCLARACLSPKAKQALAAQGRKATRNAKKANLGVPTEKRVQQSIDRMAASGVAYLTKIPTPFKVCGMRNGFMQARPEKRSIVDFLGFTSDGRVVAIEVKSVSSDPARFYLRDVPDQQREYLDRVVSCDGCGYLLVDFPTLDAWYLIPWGTVRDWVRVAPEDAGTQAYRCDRDSFWDYGGTE